MKVLIENTTLVVEAENDAEKMTLGFWDSLHRMGHGSLLLRGVMSLNRDDHVLAAIESIYDVQLVDNTWQDADMVRDEICNIFYNFAEQLGVETENLKE